LFIVLALVGLFTAFLTAFYTFRLWFRVFLGPTQYEMGTQAHGSDDDAHAASSAAARRAARPTEPPAAEHAPEAHEVGWLMNAPLVVLALGALTAGFLGTTFGWPQHAVEASTAATPAGEAVTLAGLPLHVVMMLVSGALAILGIGLAAYYHWWNRPAADRVAARYASLVRVLRNKYYVDEFYAAAIVRPLHLLGELCYLFDRMVIDGLVAALGWLPRLVGLTLAPAQSGRLQGYGLGMVLGAVTIVVLVVMVLR
jgi:NADH-quinone oxidoreductase subunit L